MKENTQPSCTFSDFTDFSALQDDMITTYKLINLYQDIFSEPDGWAENYSYEEIYNNLSHELSKPAHLRLCIDSREENEVVGFCWAQLLSLKDICQTINTVQHYNNLGTPDIFKPLNDVLNNEPMIYCHDLGIKRDLRGKLSLNKIIYPTLASVSKQTGVNKVLFWTIANTHVSALAKRAGFDLILLHSGMQFYSGTIDFARV